MGLLASQLPLQQLLLRLLQPLPVQPQVAVHCCCHRLLEGLTRSRRQPLLHSCWRCRSSSRHGRVMQGCGETRASPHAHVQRMTSFLWDCACSLLHQAGIKERHAPALQANGHSLHGSCQCATCTCTSSCAHLTQLRGPWVCWAWQLLSAQPRRQRGSCCASGALPAAAVACSAADLHNERQATESVGCRNSASEALQSGASAG